MPDGVLQSAEGLDNLGAQSCRFVLDHDVSLDVGMASEAAQLPICLSLDVDTWLFIIVNEQQYGGEHEGGGQCVAQFHIIRNQGLRLLSQRVEVDLESPSPTFKRHSQSFLGMINFYRRPPAGDVHLSILFRQIYYGRDCQPGLHLKILDHIDGMMNETADMLSMESNVLFLRLGNDESVSDVRLVEVPLTVSADIIFCDVPIPSHSPFGTTSSSFEFLHGFSHPGI
ncbi:unnamed protein product [Schistocephalus solidus]|uniref:Uncharacterized protein n=1 Tax=Schistocephalus solidus TaxID=70667 RepID=A0A183TB84_SCHSO|nr:unnamed protein product [Schistocephalus solidus]